MRSPKESAQVKKKSGPTTDPTFGSEQGRVIQQRRLCEDRLGGGSGRWRERWEWSQNQLAKLWLQEAKGTGRMTGKQTWWHGRDPGTHQLGGWWWPDKAVAVAEWVGVMFSPNGGNRRRSGWWRGQQTLKTRPYDESRGKHPKLLGLW